MRIIINGLALIFLSGVLSLYAQSPKCATELILEQEIINDLQLEPRINQIEQNYSQTAGTGLFKPNETDVKKIRVVFHIIETAGYPASKIPVERVYEQLETLNKRFRNNFNNSDPKAVDTRIEFELAKFDPQGNPTTGIVYEYTNYEKVRYDIEGSRLEYSKNRWDYKHYLNIYVCDIFDNTFLGWSSFPTYTDKRHDGIFIDYTVCRGETSPYYDPNNFGMTLVEEVGHYLGLYHTWGTANAPCGNAKANDYIDDTNPCSFPYYAGLPGYVSCGGTVIQCEGKRRDIENYMDYSMDGCESQFTAGQAKKMHFYLDGAGGNAIADRSGLLKNLQVTAKLSNGSIYPARVFQWVTSNFVANTTPAYFKVKNGSSTVFHTDRLNYVNEIYNNWSDRQDVTNLVKRDYTNDEQRNHTIKYQKYYSATIQNKFAESGNIDPANDSIYFMDPWLNDYPDPLYGNTKRNRAMNAPLKRVTSPFVNSLNAVYNGDTYKGVFLGQYYIGSNATFYKISASDYKDVYYPSISKTIRHYFLNWQGEDVDFEAAGAHTTAVKFNAENAKAEAVYKGVNLSDNINAFTNSGQNKFLTTEDENGQMTGNRLVYESMGKVWIETKTNSSEWNIANGRKPLNNGQPVVSPSFDGGCKNEINSIIYQSGTDIKISIINETGNEFAQVPVESNLTGNAKPVIASTILGRVMAVWKESDGLYYRFGCYTTTDTEKISWYGESVKIDGTDGNSENPTIATGKEYNYDRLIFHIAWEQGQSTIKMKSYKINNTPAMNTLSVWGASTYTASGAGCSSVTSLSVNSIADKTVLAYSDNGASLAGKIAEVYYYSSPIKNTGTVGKVKMSPAVSKANASVMALNTNSLPYSFNKSNALSLLKASDIKTGKEGIIAKGDAAVYFRLGDIESDGLSIEFDNKPDSIGAKTAEDIAERTTTLPFTINDASNLKFSVYYGTLDSAKAYSTLSETDKAEFEVELIDEATKAVLGSFEKTAFTKNNLSFFEKINYLVNTEGIGTREVRLRLKAKSNFGETVSISNIYEETGMQKEDEGTTKEVALSGESVVKEYSLEQNYPNPFNPATTIKYAIPNDGVVRLTIYNILGQEVKTLVNEYKLKGKYDAKFDASNLASGMYIYKIESGSFSNSKRMMLVK